jgi:hemerythrin
MHIYKWQDKYDVGVEAIDVEHRNLLTCINKLITAQSLDRAIILKLADEVYLYAQFHFLSEENLMCLTHYPNLSKHSECHRILLNELAVKKRYLESSTHGLQEYVNFLVKWFIEHTQTVDKEFGNYLNEYEPQAGSPEFIIQQLSMGKKV